MPFASRKLTINSFKLPIASSKLTPNSADLLIQSYDLSPASRELPLASREMWEFGAFCTFASTREPGVKAYGKTISSEKIELLPPSFFLL